MPLLALLLTLLALHSATARADGFFDPPEPTPERRAELDALCSRLEALGLPAIPPEAEWAYIEHERGSHHFGERNDVYFDQYSKTARGNAWRLPAEESGGTNVFVTVDGRRIVLPPDSGAQTAWAPVRIQRDIVGLHKALDENANLTDEYRLDSVGKSLLFAAELFRSGREAAADALVAAIERDPRGLSGAERDAAIFRARADVRAAGLAFFASGDFAALAAALEDSLRRIPPLGEKDDGAPVNDRRETWLAQLRPRLAGEQPPELEGLDEENQALARALADEPAGPNHYENLPHFYHDNNLPWLLPAAWTNFVANDDDVQTRILRRGPAALPLLAAMAEGDAWPVVGDWRANDWADAIPPFCTRADVAKRILTRFAFATLKVGWDEDRSAVAARLRDRLANATEEEVARFYLGVAKNELPALLEAWLARRAGAGPLPWLEDAILAGLQGPFVYSFYAEDLFAGGRALDVADSYLAVRGEAAAAFRNRIVEALQVIAETATMPGKKETTLPDGRVQTVEYEYIPNSFTFKNDEQVADLPEQYISKLRNWATGMARQFAGLELASGAPDDIRNRAETLAAWHDRTSPDFNANAAEPLPYPLPRLDIRHHYPPSLTLRKTVTSPSPRSSTP